MSRFRLRIPWDVLALLTLLAAGWKFGLPADRWFDIPAFDEARYLHRGLEVWRVGLARLPAQWSPLYSLWYALLSRLGARDRIHLYYLNFRLLGALLPAGCFLVLRRSRVAFWPAFALSLYTVSARLSWVTDTRVTSFAMLLVMVVAWGLSFLPRGWLRLAAGGLSMLVVAFARPEYTLAAGVLLAAALWMGYRTWRRGASLWTGPRWALLGLLAPLALAVAAWGLWGSPVGARSMYAFGQHFAYTRWYCLGQPRRGISWEDEVQADFGQARTILQALMVNPRAFGSHLWCNLKAFPPRLGSTLFLHAAYFLPQKPLVEALLFAGLAGLFLLYMAARRGRHLLRKAVREAPEDMLFWAAMALVGLSVLLVIHGAKRYYLILLGWPLMVLAGLLFLPRGTTGNPSITLGKGLAGLLLGLALVPPMGYMTPYPWEPPFLENLELLKTLQALSLPKDRPLRWVSTRGLRHYFLMLYLEGNFQALPYAPEEGFLADIQEKRPDIITVDTRWFYGDASWEAFRDRPQAYGYWRRSVGKHRLLFVRRDVIPPP